MGSSSSALSKHSTAHDVVAHYAAGNPEFLKGKLAVVTGGNSGVGLQTVKALAAYGCRVILASRSVSNGEEMLSKEIVAPGIGGYAVPDAKSLVFVRQLDLNSLASVKAFADQLIADGTSIDYLVFNAGVMALPALEKTEDGFEKQIGVNHFGHFYLWSQLQKKVTSQNVPCRLVAVSSEAHRMGPVDVADLHYQNGRKYSAWGSYAQSKLANILFIKGAADHLANTKVCAVSLHPGIIQTNLQRHMGGWLTWLFNIVVDKSIPQGAATSVYACLEPSLDTPALRGSYLKDCQVATPNAAGLDADGKGRKALWEATATQLAAATAAAKLQ